MKLTPSNLERLALRKEKLGEELANLQSSLNGQALPLAPFISDAFGNYSEARCHDFLDELTQAWGLHEVYRNNWDFEVFAKESSGEFEYELDANKELARHFIYCAARLVATCPWFFSGTLGELCSLAAHLGSPADAYEEAGEFSLVNDVYALLGSHASFFQNMEALKRLLTREEAPSASELVEGADDFLLEALAREVAEASPEELAAMEEDARWDDSAEQARWFDDIENTARAWKRSFTDKDALLAHYDAFVQALADDSSAAEHLADELSFAIDVMLANHDASPMLHDAVYFSAYNQLLGIQQQLAGVKE